MFKDLKGTMDKKSKQMETEKWKLLKICILERPFSLLCREGLEGVKIGFSLEKAMQEFRQVMMIA